jgi:hypothetical protein
MCDEEDKEVTEIRLPKYAVLLRSNHKRLPKVVAMFASRKEAVRYLDGYRALKRHEFLTLESKCPHDENTCHIHSTLTHKDMSVVETDSGLKAVPDEVAPCFGDFWVTGPGHAE